MKINNKDKNIVLIGFMGSGKTSVGKRLSLVLKREFIDTDDFIEKREGMTINEIFKEKGEEEFLKEDGVFVFDMNSHYKYKEILACNTFAEDREDASFIWDNFYDEEERINEYQLSLFIQNEQGTYNKYEELHLQKAYEQEEVVSFLYEAGFSSVRVLDAETMDEVKEDTQRLYYIAN